MLNPRVVNLKPPPCNILYKNGSISDGPEITRIVSNHFFNYSVCLVLPDTTDIPGHIKDILTVDTEYYKLFSVPLHLLISQDFIDFFVNCGEITAVCINKLIDTDNCIALTPCGHLILSLDYKTYQELGLVKGPAVDVRKMKDFYFVIINLKTKCFKIGSKNYENAYRNLVENSSLKFDLLLSWEPSDDKVCPSSVAKYFSRHLIDVNECSVEESKRISYSVKFPLFSTDQEEMFEWFGTFLFDIHNSSSSRSDANDDITIFEDPENYEEIGQVVLMNWTGLFTRKKILQLFNEIKKLAVELHEVPWIGFGVLGYLDTPVAWGLRPHYFRTSGENDYTILLNHEGKYLMCINSETCSKR